MIFYKALYTATGSAVVVQHAHCLHTSKLDYTKTHPVIFGCGLHKNRENSQSLAELLVSGAGGEGGGGGRKTLLFFILIA